MNKIANIKDELRAKSLSMPKARVDLAAENVKLVEQNSPFFGMFQPDEYSGFVEFDICHSLPVIAGPAFHTANYTCWHPAALARSHRGLLYKQTNLHHFIKSYEPEDISRDRIVGAVVMTTYPNEPEGGWKIPDKKEAAIPIRACATIFKQAEGALEMLRDHKTGRQKWSVSIEVSGRTIDEMGIYFPAERKLLPFLEVPDEVLEAAVTKDDCNCLCLGKFNGEQLALCYGGVNGSLIFRGVGFTPSPAEKEARITGVNLSNSLSQSGGLSQTGDYEVEEKPGGIFAMCASSSREALARAALASCFKGASLVKVWTEGEARLKGHFWKLDASAERPVIEFRVAGGKPVLRYLDELTEEAAA